MLISIDCFLFMKCCDNLEKSTSLKRNTFACVWTLLLMPNSTSWAYTTIRNNHKLCMCWQTRRHQKARKERHQIAIPWMQVFNSVVQPSFNIYRTNKYTYTCRFCYVFHDQFTFTIHNASFKALIHTLDASCLLLWP